MASGLANRPACSLTLPTKFNIAVAFNSDCSPGAVLRASLQVVVRFKPLLLLTANEVGRNLLCDAVELALRRFERGAPAMDLRERRLRWMTDSG